MSNGPSTAEPGTVDVLIYVQHLLGIGHLQRAATLARALAGQGLATALVSGGVPVPGLDVGDAGLIQLPPLRAGDADFSFLADAEGRPVDDDYKAARCDALLAALERLRPKALLVEMFPFGRRALRFELLPLLDAARAADALIACSLRDVVNHPIAEDKARWIRETLEARFDLLLVHGDPQVIALAESFPAAERLSLPLIHTGYVAPEPVRPIGDTRFGEVVVSAGGGAVGAPLLDCALEARAQSCLVGRPWRLIAGANAPAGQFAELCRRAPTGVTVERSRADYRRLLAGARLSISQAGYNSMVELLQARVPAVVVPYVTEQETEQGLRAAAWARHGLVELLPAAALSPRALGEAVDRAMDRALAGAAPDVVPDLNGAARTAEILTERIRGDAR